MRSHWIYVVGLVLTLAACRPQAEEPTTEVETPEGSGEEAETEAGEDTNEVPEQTVDEAAALMEGHYVTAMSANNAVVRGNLEEFRYHLGRLAQNAEPEGAPESWQPHAQRLGETAAAGSTATDSVSAAVAVGRGGEVCGQCPIEHGIELIYGSLAMPEGTGVGAAMRGHEWASERMWEGIVDPSAEGWQAGSDQLASLDVLANLSDPSDELRHLETLLKELAIEAQVATTHSDRAQLYGRLLMSCSGCHTEANVVLESE